MYRAGGNAWSGLMNDSIGEHLFRSAVMAENQKQGMDLLAGLISDLMDSLVDKGFSREEGLMLCNTWMAVMVTGVQKK